MQVAGVGAEAYWEQKGEKDSDLIGAEPEEEEALKEAIQLHGLP